MSDCIADMKPNEHRTCGTCKHVKYTHLDCFYAANNNAYYMGQTAPHAKACKHYVDDPDSLPRRYEYLAQVAMEMLEAMRVSRNSAYGFYRRLLDGCGVIVDDQAEV